MYWDQISAPKIHIYYVAQLHYIYVPLLLFMILNLDTTSLPLMICYNANRKQSITPATIYYALVCVCVGSVANIFCSRTFCFYFTVGIHWRMVATYLPSIHTMSLPSLHVCVSMWIFFHIFHLFQLRNDANYDSNIQNYFQFIL